MKKLRVVLVEDSLTVRRYLCDLVTGDPDLEVAGEAGDGMAAIELCNRLRPDVIAMDMVLPIVSGLAATEVIMAQRPTPILIVSAALNRAGLFKTYEALAAGAVDVLDKPHDHASDHRWEQRFLAALKMVARVRVITHPRALLATGRRALESPSCDPVAPPSALPCAVVAIGASTGGPGALVRVLAALSADFQVPLLVVLHLGEQFGDSFAGWLEGQIGRRVANATDGESLKAVAGQVRMAPPAHHLVVRDGRLRLTDDPEANFCRPSVDVLFDSVSLYCEEAAACLLTGAGRDGAAGLLRIRRAGGLTIAQDEATSAVYGMPREAALLGAAKLILPLAGIGDALAALGARSRRAAS